MRLVRILIITVAVFVIATSAASASGVRSSVNSRFHHSAFEPGPAAKFQNAGPWVESPYLLNEPRAVGGAAFDRSGRLYVIGGTTKLDFGYEISSVERLGTNGWNLVAPLPVGQVWPNAVLGPKGRIYVGGGFSAFSPDYQAWWAYEPSIDEWIALPRIPASKQFRAFSSIATLNGLVYAIGGENQYGAVRRVDAYNPWTHTWRSVPKMPEGRIEPAAIGGSDGYLYVIGGQRSAPTRGGVNFYDTRTILRYDPTTRTWTTLPERLINPGVLTTPAEVRGHIYLGDQIYTPATGVVGCTDPVPGYNITKWRGTLYSIGWDRSYSYHLPVTDTIAPHFLAPPGALFIDRGKATDETVPVQLRWLACDNESGVARYDVGQRIDQGTVEPVNLPTPTTTSMRVRLPADRHVRELVVGATDGSENTATATGPAFQLRRYQDRSPRLVWHGTWHTGTSPRLLGGHDRYSAQPGASVTLSFHGSSVSLVAPEGPRKGIAMITLDGGNPWVVDLHRRTATQRRLVYTHSWPEVADHTITIRVHKPLACEVCDRTPATRRVDIDAILVL